ncbi:hypothetical protein [Marispirochaeta aestuarii]|uniref:hypothetical protein n=1 Tax=Marispirochaeta aestuarii TaxID=1963862 RepID=UPI002ABE7706|nr:hypothetical protein [Marispirochaeta aestuarii]
MYALTEDDFRSIEYLNPESFNQLYGRSPVLLPYKNSNDEWKIPFVRNNKVIFIDGIPQASVYCAKEIDDATTDIYLNLLDFIYKRSSYPYIVKLLDSLKYDVHKLFTINAKIDILYKYNQDKECMSDLIQSEIEYLFIVCKSIYDSLQNMITKFWDRNVIVIRKGYIKKKLPDTYSKIIYKNKELSSLNEIIERYSLPEPLANYYYESGRLFDSIKTVRDDIVHHGKGIDYIFSYEKGFAVTEESTIYKNFDVLKKNSQNQNNLISIRPMIKYLITEMLSLLDNYTKSINSVLKFPMETITDYKIYLRIPQIKYYNRMVKELEKTEWWHDTA